jgi:fructose-1,6-bisphosphatase I
MATINGSNIHPPVQQEKVNTDIITLTRFLTEEQAKHPEATGDFTYVGF